MYDRQGCLRRFNLCPNCLRAHEESICQSKEGALWKDPMASITQHSVGQMQDNSNKMHNQMGTGIQSHKTMSSETKPKQNQSNYGLIMKKNEKLSSKFNNENQRQQTSSIYNQQSGNQNRQGGSNSSSYHGGIWNKKGFHPQPTNAQNNISRQQSNNQCTVVLQQATTPQQKTTLAATNRKLLGSDRRYSCR